MSQVTSDAATGIGHGAKRLWQGMGMALALSAMLLLGLGGTASAADRTVQLELDASEVACTAWDQMDCSYLEARNGNAPAPDPQTDAEPTFLNLALLPEPVTIDATIDDNGTVTIPQGSVNFPPYPTTLDNDLVGPVTIQISINQTDEWTGTFNDGTGEMSLTAPLGLEFDVTCDATDTEYPLCGGAFGGNMGTWVVDTTGPVDPLTTGHLDAPDPPAAYGTDWLGPVVEDGSPLDAGSGAITLINNDLVIKAMDTNSCIDETSAACSNPILGGLLLEPLNDALGTTDNAEEPAFMNSQPGAIDMRLAMVMTEEEPVEPFELTANHGLVTFGSFVDKTFITPSNAASLSGEWNTDTGDVTIPAAGVDIPSLTFDLPGAGSGSVGFAPSGTHLAGRWKSDSGHLMVRGPFQASVELDNGEETLSCHTTANLRFSTDRTVPYRGTRFTSGLEGDGGVVAAWEDQGPMRGDAGCEELDPFLVGPGGMWLSHDMNAPYEPPAPTDPVMLEAPSLHNSDDTTDPVTPGRSLTCEAGQWNNYSQLTFVWFKDEEEINNNKPNGTGKNSYRTQATDAGASFTCAQTARAHGSTTWVVGDHSNAMDVIAP